jgi:hypothetical protein
LVIDTSALIALALAERSRKLRLDRIEAAPERRRFRRDGPRRGGSLNAHRLHVSRNFAPRPRV